MTVEALQQGLATHAKGVLKHGAHTPDAREFCALEFSSVMRGKPFSDKPGDLPNIQPLNDAFWWSSDLARTQHMLPVLAALWDWASWSPNRRQVWATQIAIATTAQIISQLPQVPDPIRGQCANAVTTAEAAAAAAAAGAAARAVVQTDAAAEAAWAAAWAAEPWKAVRETAEAAWAAARAAGAAARAATPADAERPLQTLCRIYVDAAAATEGL